jgi:hypothetical protein
MIQQNLKNDVFVFLDCQRVLVLLSVVSFCGSSRRCLWKRNAEHSVCGAPKCNLMHVMKQNDKTNKVDLTNVS